MLKNLQQDGFASDSVRMINNIRREVAEIQILLFSATFSEKVKAFAIKVVGSNANQVVSTDPKSFLSSAAQHSSTADLAGGIVKHKDQSPLVTLRCCQQNAASRGSS